MPRGRPKGSKNKSYLEPIVKSEDAHVFTNEMPILTSVGLARIHADSKEYVSYVITSKGNEILKIEVAEPNLKAIAVESAKISFVDHFLNEEIL